MAKPHPEERTPEEMREVVRFKELTERILPGLATQERWPVTFDHCFKRICLDWAFGDVWYKHLARPAERHIQGDPLRRALSCAADLAEAGLPLLKERDAASLRWRDKPAKAHRRARIAGVQS